MFRTVGIDRSHYAPLSADEWRFYASQLPSGFRCVAKVWDEITTRVFPNHPRFGKRRGQVNPHFLDAEYYSTTVATPLLEGFKDHLGPQVLEITPQRTPPDSKDFENKLETFLKRAPAGLHYAVELRNPTLLTRRYFDILRHFAASHVLNFWTGMPPLSKQMSIPGALAGPCTVVRLMLPPFTRYDERKREMSPFDRLVQPQPEMRADVVSLVRSSEEHNHRVYVLAGNKAEGCSPLTVQAIARMLVEH